MSVGKVGKKKPLLALFVVMNLIMSFMPMGMRTLQAEELSEEAHQVEQIEIQAELKWIDLPDGISLKGSTLNLLAGDKIIESIDFAAGKTKVKFSSVDKYDSTGSAIKYTIEQEALKDFETTINGFVVENTYVRPPEKAPEKPLKDETAPVAEDPAAEKGPPVEAAPSTEAAPPTEIAPPTEATSPIEVTPADAETPILEEIPQISDQPVGSDGVIPSKSTSHKATFVDLSRPAGKQPLKNPLSTKIGLNAITSPTDLGQVTYDKSAVPVPGLVNTWDITLRIEGKDAQKTSDIVLVIDRSGSMAEPGSAGQTKLQDAKTAAKNFITTLQVAQGNAKTTRIALVSYASKYLTSETVTTHTGFLDISDLGNRNTLNTAIDSLAALGGTNTQAGIKVADEMFNAVLIGQKADFNHLVLLSDGLPTESYTINTASLTKDPTNTATFISVGNNDYHTKTTLPENVFNSPSIAGDGTSETTLIGQYTSPKPKVTSTFYYNHSNSAISQANIFRGRALNRTLWTIALQTTAHGNDVLKDIASSASNALLASASDLNTKLQQIAGSINAAAKNIKVTDPIAPGFEIIPNAAIADINTSQGTKTYTGRVIEWDAGALSTETSTGSKIRYVQMSYRISISPDILTIKPAPSDGLYPTNGVTTLTYKDTDNQAQTRNFIVPKVNPVFLKIKKLFVDASGKPLTPTELFDVNVKSGPRNDLPYQGFGQFNKLFSLIGNADFVVSTDLRLADTYTVTEVTPGYEVSYTVKTDGLPQNVNTFTVTGPTSTDSGQNDIEVVVTNKLLGTIVLNKLLVDVDGIKLTGDPNIYPLDQSFQFTITGPSNYSEVKTIKPDEAVTITGLKYGEYTVTETNLPANFEKVSSIPTNGKITLSTVNKQGSVTIKNTLRKDVVISKIVSGNLGDQNKNFMFTATLTTGAGVPVMFPQPPANSGYTVSGNIATFDLKHGETVILIGLPIGAKVTIVETDNNGYSVSVKKNSESPIPGSSLTMIIPTIDTAVEFTNYKGMIIDTGVSLDSLPYIMILVLLITGGFGRILWKRKRRDHV